MSGQQQPPVPEARPVPQSHPATEPVSLAQPAAATEPVPATTPVPEPSPGWGAGWGAPPSASCRHRRFGRADWQVRRLGRRMGRAAVGRTAGAASSAGKPWTLKRGLLVAGAPPFWRPVPEWASMR